MTWQAIAPNGSRIVALEEVVTVKAYINGFQEQSFSTPQYAGESEADWNSQTGHGYAIDDQGNRWHSSHLTWFEEPA